MTTTRRVFGAAGGCGAAGAAAACRVQPPKCFRTSAIAASGRDVAGDREERRRPACNGFLVELYDGIARQRLNRRRDAVGRIARTGASRTPAAGRRRRGGTRGRDRRPAGSTASAASSDRSPACANVGRRTIVGEQLEPGSSADVSTVTDAWVVSSPALGGQRAADRFNRLGNLLRRARRPCPGGSARRSWRRGRHRFRGRRARAGARQHEGGGHERLAAILDDEDRQPVLELRRRVRRERERAFGSDRRRLLLAPSQRPARRRPARQGQRRRR